LNQLVDFFSNVPVFAQLRDPFLFWVLSAICAFSIGFSKNGVSGLAVLVVPLMAIIFPAKASTGILLPLLIAGDCVALWSFRAHGDWKHIIRSLPWALIGICCGWIVMGYPGFSGVLFKRFIGGIVIFVIFLGEYLAWRGNSDNNLRISHTLFFVIFFGVLGGFATMTANAAGPVFAVYLLALNLPKENFIGSSARIFFILNLIKVPFSAQLGLINVETLIFDIMVLPFLVVGAYFGFRTAKIIPQKIFNYIIKALAFIAALKLIF